jgi:uncharacterized RDD family membrane protein YckC
MLIATFGPSTARVGKTIEFENEVFLLEGHGPVTASDVMRYDSQGHLLWVSEEIRYWAGARAGMPVVPRAATTPKSTIPAGPDPAAGDVRATYGNVFHRIIAALIDLLISGVIGAFIYVSVLPSWGSLRLDLIRQGVTLVACWYVYLFASEAIWGTTVGKRIFRLRVVMLDGRRCTAGAAALRNLTKTVFSPWVPGLISATLTQEGQGLFNIPAQRLTGLAVVVCLVVATVLMKQSGKGQRLGDSIAGTAVTRTVRVRSESAVSSVLPLRATTGGQGRPAAFDWTSADERRWLIEGIAKTYSNWTLPLLSMLAKDNSPAVAADAAQAATRIQARPQPQLRTSGSQVLSVEEALQSLKSKHRRHQMQSLGRCLGNPTEHNVALLARLSREEDDLGRQADGALELLGLWSEANPVPAG